MEFFKRKGERGFKVLLPRLGLDAHSRRKRPRGWDRRCESFQRRFRVVRITLDAGADADHAVALVLAVILLLFLHQLFWVDKDPEVAFDRAAGFVEGTEVVWDTFGIVGNAASDVLNAAVIPVYNSIAFTVFEPFVMLILEVFSLVFLNHSYEGVLTEEQFPYSGLLRRIPRSGTVVRSISTTQTGSRSPSRDETSSPSPSSLPPPPAAPSVQVRRIRKTTR